MRALRIGLLVTGSALIIGTVLAYLITPLPRPLLILLFSVGVAFVWWHNAVLWFQQGMRKKNSP